MNKNSFLKSILNQIKFLNNFYKEIDVEFLKRNYNENFLKMIPRKGGDETH